jgi:hypothetical protein
MAVTFTTNIGLAKPTESELAKNWATSGFDKLCEDNNLQIIAKMNISLQTFTPSVKAQTSDPNLGVGTAKMDYIDVQNIIMGSFVITFTDPGVATGNGEIGIQLPEEVDNSFHTVGNAFNGAIGANSVVGNGYVQDGTSVPTSGAVALDVITISSVSYLRMITEPFAGKAARLVTSAQPFPPATTDRYSGFFCYRKL